MARRLIVVVPTAGKCDLLLRTLKSLASCDLPEVYERTVVVENGPAGSAEQIVESAPRKLRAEYFHVDRANKSHALNCVFERFDDDDLIYLVDDDIRFAPKTVLEIAEAADGVSGGYVFGGPMRIDSEGEPPVRWREFLPGSMKGWEPLESDFNPRNHFFLGANWAVFSGDVRRAGHFDPRFGPGSALGATGQEWTMQIALRKQGAKFVYLPNAIVWHHVDISRFSRDFLIHRKYRGGLEAGIRSADFVRNSPRWRDFVLTPTLRAEFRLFRHRFMASLCRMLGLETAQFRHELYVEHSKGFLTSFSKSDAQTTEITSS